MPKNKATPATPVDGDDKFNPALDIILQDHGIVPGTAYTNKEGTLVEGSDYHMATRSYNGGTAKVSVFRVLGKNKDKVRSVFRISREDAIAIAKHILLTFDVPVAKPAAQPAKNKK